jgi:DNA-binding NtrC family response regulator
LLKGDAHEVASASSAEEALVILEKQSFDLMLSDIRMSPMDGMQLLQISREKHPDMPVIMLTAFGSVSTAVDALKLGAFDYLTKPFKIDELLRTVKRALEYTTTSKENVEVKAQLNVKYGVENIIAASPAMKRVCDMIRRVGPTDATVLITGEVGTAKEQIARAIHASSSRKNKSFIVMRCEGMDEADLDVELFGCAKDALPGIDQAQAGALESVEDGTLMIESVHALPPALQTKLLKMLQSREAKRRGSETAYPVKARLITTTDLPLGQLVGKGDFLEDLHLRLRVISIDLPALRMRQEDIPELVQHWCQQQAAGGGIIPRVSAEALDLLTGYDWPGNDQEFESVLAQVLLTAGLGETILPDHLPPALGQALPKKTVGIGSKDGLERAASLKAFLREKEREYLQQVLKTAGGDQAVAAEKLHITVEALQRKLTEAS